MELADESGGEIPVNKETECIAETAMHSVIIGVTGTGLCLMRRTGRGKHSNG